MDAVIERRRSNDAVNFPGMPKVIQNILTARGVAEPSDIDYQLNQLLPFTSLSNIEQAAKRLADAVSLGEHILIVGDFDVDGATSTTVAVLSLRAMGAQQVSYLVPNRFEYGYGLSSAIVDVAAKMKPDLIVTVDNGISSVDGVKRAREYGIDVLVTDHHLPGEQLPEDCIIVDPSLHGDIFPSKSLAGVGVIFYVMLALRAELKAQSFFENKNIANVNMSQFLDLVALGTVADLVPLDKNNRILVKQGLRRIRQNSTRPGIQALIDVSKRNIQELVANDFGFAIAPRLNAAGRLDDMSLGIECLLSSDYKTARAMAEQLDSLNIERKAIEQQMKLEAVKLVDKINLQPTDSYGLCLYEKSWHQGVVGLVASRIKDQAYKPVIAFADAGDGSLKGSGRSIPGLNLRDVLQRVDTLEPGLLLKFGGHAMAAGMSIMAASFDRFHELFNEAVLQMTASDLFNKVWLTDGELSADSFTLDMACLIQEHGPWGQGFPEPIFDGVFDIIDQRIVGGNHLKLSLQPAGGLYPVDAICFYVDTEIWPNHNCSQLKAIYQLDVNLFRDTKKLQLIVQSIWAL